MIPGRPHEKGECGTELLLGASCKCVTEIALFHGRLVDIQSEMLALKHQHDEMKNNFKGEINSIKTDLTTLQSDIVTAVNERRDTASYCRQSIENLNDEHCNGIASVKSDVKQIRGEIQSMYEYIDPKDTELCNKFSNISSPEKRIAKLESKTEKIKEDMKDSLHVNKKTTGH